MRVEATVIAVMDFLLAIDLTLHALSAGAAAGVTSEPGSSGRVVLSTRTGIARSIAGRSVFGWRTFAPK